MQRRINFLLIGMLLVTACTSAVSSTPPNTPAPTIASAQPVVSTVTPNPSPTPAITYSNLKQVGNTIVGTNSITGMEEVIVAAQEDAKLDQFLASSDEKLLVLQSHVQNGNNKFLQLFDIRTRQVSLIYQGQSSLLAVAFSPDGHWLVYIPPTTKQASFTLKSIGRNAVPAIHSGWGGGDGIDSGWVYAVQTNNVEQAYKIGYCGYDPITGPDKNDIYKFCSHILLWSPDSKALLWSDIRGLWQWQADPNIPARELEAIPDGQRGNYVGEINPLEWSPSGRFVRVEQRLFEGSTMAVVDTQTSRLEVIPNSFEYAYPGPEYAWSPEGNLLLVRHPKEMGIWSIETGSTTGRLILDEKIDYVPASEPALTTQLSIDKNALKQKDPATGGISIVVPARDSSTVLKGFSASDDLNQIALIYWNTTRKEFTVEWLNRITSKTTMVLHGKIFDVGDSQLGLLAMSMAPNGKWLAYAEADSSLSRQPNDVFHLASYDIGGGGCGALFIKAEMYIVQANTLNESKSGGDFSNCYTQSVANIYADNNKNVQWSYDSTEIGWSYIGGALSAQLDQPEIQLPKDSQGLNWSPQGRYLLIKFFNGQYAIFDTQTKQTIMAPDDINYYADHQSTFADQLAGKLTWLNDGRLFIVRYPPATETWKIDSNGEKLLVQELTP